ANRPLTDARVQLAGQPPRSLRLQAADFASEAFDVSGASHCVFTLQDQFGLESSGPWRLAIRPQKDAPPVPELADLPREVAILESEVLEINLAAKDDFGVRELALNWEVAADWRGTNAPVRQEFKTT